MRPGRGRRKGGREGRMGLKEGGRVGMVTRRWEKRKGG
jgi:hypothetical protein